MDAEKQIVQFARLAAEDRPERLRLAARSALTAVARARPDLAEEAAAVAALLGNSPTRARRPEERRNVPAPLPVDTDSRLELLRRDEHVTVPVTPIWPEAVSHPLQETVEERCRAAELARAGLTPTRSVLLVGPPGVGKTLSAHWLAARLDLPLLTLDLSAVMSSFLGRTGSNLRVVLDYARRSPSVLLLDEFDAIAKRRDDAVEVGELKRLVTVLLQEIDEWPADGLLLAATNHPELLDPAVWRRFDRVVHFPLPSAQLIADLVRTHLPPAEEEAARLADTLGVVLEGHSPSDVTRLLATAHRGAVLHAQPLPAALAALIRDESRRLDPQRRQAVARTLEGMGLSQRRVSELTGVSRDTLRRHRPRTED